MYKINFEGINNLYQVGNWYFGGQPSDDALHELLQKGVKKVFNLRNVEEGDFSNQAELTKSQGAQYFHLPLIMGGQFSSECVEQLNALDPEEKVLIHCASGNRIGAWYIVYCVKVKGMEWEDAMDEGFKAGMTRAETATFADQYLN